MPKQSVPLEERYENMIREGCLMDDYVFVAAMDGQPELIAEIIETVTDIQVDEVLEMTVQRTLPNPVGRELKLDVYVRDKRGNLFNVEVQNSDAGAVPQRARYHSALLDTTHLPKSAEFKNLGETYVIFLTKHDIIGLGELIYYIDRTVWTRLEFLNEDTVWKVPRGIFPDGAHIIYVNGEKEDLGSKLGCLVHDLKQVDPNNMITSLRDRMQYLKQAEGGQGMMSDKFRSYFKEELEQGREEGRESAFFDAVNAGEMTAAGAAKLCNMTEEEFLRKLKAYTPA